MALTSARDILNKKILGTGGGVPSADEIPIDIAGLSATKLSVGLEEIVLDIDQLSTSVLTISEKVEDITTYSETERIVGKWIDGSDIYEKTIVLDEDVTTTANQWSSTGITMDEIDMILDAKIILNTPANENAAVTVIAWNDSGIKIYYGIALVFTTMIIQYTKTAAESKKKSTRKSTIKSTK